MKAFKDNKETFNWCGYEWECCMEGKRIIHPDTPWYWMDKDKVQIEDNNTLVLSLRQSHNTVYHWRTSKEYNPTMACGTIRSVKPFSYGTFSADIKLPKGSGLWPSFWLSGEYCWPPEIDIMEAWCESKGYFRLTTPQFPYINPSWKVTTNVHYNGDTMIKKDCGSRNISIFDLMKNPANNFVNYKVVWLPDSIKFYVNNELVRTINSSIANDLVMNTGVKDGNSHMMDVIFNVWCENPEEHNVNMNTPMYIKNFKYVPI